jgi:hypothetical protein
VASATVHDAMLGMLPQAKSDELTSTVPGGRTSGTVCADKVDIPNFFK